MKLGLLSKQFVLAFFALFISCILSACGSGTSSSSGSSGNSAAPVALGVLSNGSTLYTSTNYFPISDVGTSVSGVLTLIGGTAASYTISFGNSVLQGTQKTHTNTSRLQSTDSNGIVITPSSCVMGTIGSGSPQECGYTVSASESTSVGTYAVEVMATDSNGLVQNLGSITILVSATVAPSSNSITAYSLNGNAGVITGTNIAVEVPYGTDVSSLVATYITTGASVAVGSTIQTNGVTANNFTSPVVYTVTAANGNTQNYTVTVTAASVSSKAITAYSLNGTAGVINGTNITVEMPYGTDLTNLVATFTTSGSSVDIGGIPQASGTTLNNFTNPVIYTVVAADGSTQNYTVIVTIATPSDNAITAYSLNGTTGVISGTNIAVEMPYGTDVTSLISTFTITGSSVDIGGVPQVSGTTANNFTSPVIYTVTAADGSTQNYTVTVTVAASSAKAITAYSLGGTVGIITGTSIAVEVPYGTDVTNLIATFTTDGSSVAVNATPQVSGTTPNDFTSPVTYTVTAANGSTQNYTVTVTVPAPTWTNVGSAGFSAGFAFYTAIAFNPTTNQPYVVYQDVGNDNKATVMKYDGTSWVNVGTPGFSANTVNYTAIAFNPATKEPYVVYQDAGNDGKATVMKFNGTIWVNVGNAGFSAGQAEYTTIAFNPATNQPYVVYQDSTRSNKATMMKFESVTSSWVNVGNAGFSASTAPYLSVTFNPATKEPYVVYRDGGNAGGVTVMKFNGTWSNVGNAGFSAGSATYTDIAFNPSTNEPYVVYRDMSTGGFATVMKFDRVTLLWVTVGSVGFSSGPAEFTKIAFNPATNEPYVVYMDSGNASKATVMSFNGTWNNVGSPGFSAGIAGYTTIAFNLATNQPYVVYMDGGNSNKATVMKF